MRAPMAPLVTVAIVNPRLAQNCHATTGDLGATSRHHSSALVPDARRRMISPGLMNATGDALGWPPAIHVAAVRTSHGTIQSATSAALVQTSREAWVRGRGVAAIGPHHVVAPRVTQCGQCGPRPPQSTSAAASASISSASCSKVVCTNPRTVITRTRSASQATL